MKLLRRRIGARRGYADSSKSHAVDIDHSIHYYARYLEHPSGVTDALDHWAEISRLAGDRVTILCARPKHSRNIDRNSLPVRAIDHLGTGRTTWVPTGLLGELRPGCLLILHEGWVLSNVAAVVIAKVKGAKVILMPHGVYEQGIVDGQKDILGFRFGIERWCLRRADAVHVFYHSEQEVVSRFEPTVRSFIIAPNGAPKVTDADQWRGQGAYFLWLGRFDVNHKGLDRLLNFWARLAEPRPQLILAGPDFSGGKALVIRMVVQLGLEQDVILRGHVAGKEKQELLASCRAYLHPSRWESCSIMLLEALAAGVPCLISSSIHAATELGQSSILATTDFDLISPSADEVLAKVDRNADLGNRAKHWAETTGGWHKVDDMTSTQLESLGLRSARGL